jgi:Plant transposon protein
MSDSFGDEFMRLPTADDLKGLVALHKEMRGAPGMFGSLDCMHTTYWKNCPVVAWQQSLKGKASGPTIVMEAIADYNLWFWHVNWLHVVLFYTIWESLIE